MVFSSIFPKGKGLSATLGTQLFLMIDRSFKYLTNILKEMCTFTNSKNFNENPVQVVQIFSSYNSPLLPKRDSKPNQTKKKTPPHSPLKTRSITVYHISTLEHVREQMWIWSSLISVLATAPYCARSKTIVSTAWNVCNIHRQEKKNILALSCRELDFSVHLLEEFLHSSYYRKKKD